MQYREVLNSEEASSPSGVKAVTVRTHSKKRVIPEEKEGMSGAL
jgi:hypothetical protein